MLWSRTPALLEASTNYTQISVPHIANVNATCSDLGSVAMHPD